VRRLTGWAFDVAARRPVDRVLAFAGRRLLYDARPRDLRPAVASALRVDPADLGWRADVPEGDWHAAGAPLRVFGVSGRTAGELPFVCVGDAPQEPGCPRLTLSGGAIRAAGGGAIPVVRRGVAGAVQDSAVRGAALVVDGRARTTDGRPVDRIVAFAGGRMLFSGPPATARFAFDVPSRVLRGARARPRVFAVVGRRAVALRAAR